MSCYIFVNGQFLNNMFLINFLPFSSQPPAILHFKQCYGNILNISICILLQKRYRVKLITTGKGREKGGKQATQLTTITRKQAFKYFIFTAFVYHLLVFIYYVATSENESMFEVAEIAHDEMWPKIGNNNQTVQIWEYVMKYSL